MRPRKVCVCKQVSEEEIVHCIKIGMTSVEEISYHTSASTGCGTCVRSIQNLIDRELKKGNGI
jgi:bacterioferritin-associated ferredoxin